MASDGTPADPKRRAGIALIAIGVLTIVGAVVYVLEVANGPGTGPKTFAQRRSYNQVKESVHQSFPVAFVVGLVGLGTCVAGSRLLKRVER